MKIVFLRLPHGEGLPLPAYASDGAAGMDVAAALEPDHVLVLEPRGRALAPTGFALELPPGFEAQLRPRSGLALRHGVTVLNAPGTIDSDYRGELQVLLINHGAEAVSITRGQRIAQLVIAPVVRVEAVETREPLTPSARAGRGFGSSGWGGAPYGETE